MPEITIIDIGDQVFCDDCYKDYTLDAKTSGGLLFGSKAFCPDCVSRIEAAAKKYNEEQYITQRCPEGMSFRDWCLQLRNGNNKIVISNLEI